MPRGTTPAQPTTNAAVLPARWPLPSIEPGRTRMGDAGGMFGGAIHPEMGRRNGALCTHLDFLNRLSHEPGLLKYFVLH